MVPIYSSDVVIWFYVVLICVAPDMLTHYKFEKKKFLKFFFFQIFKNFFSSNLVELCLEKVIFKSTKKNFFFKKIFVVMFFFRKLQQN